MQESVKILRSVDKRYIDAKIVPLSQKHLEEIELTWKPQLKIHNCWDKNVELSKMLQEAPYIKLYVLESNLVTQGIIGLNYNFPSKLEPGKEIVYLELLLVAPWNRIKITNTPEHKGVGTSLVTFAITHSLELGCEGRIGVFSFKEADTFYEKMNFVNLGDNINYKKLNYLELSTNDAELLILNYLLLCNLN